jgi:hypothetical protein
MPPIAPQASTNFCSFGGGQMAERGLKTLAIQYCAFLVCGAYDRELYVGIG